MNYNVRTDIDACGCKWECTGTVRESALQVDSGRKMPRRSDVVPTELHRLLCPPPVLPQPLSASDVLALFHPRMTKVVAWALKTSPSPPPLSLSLSVSVSSAVSVSVSLSPRFCVSSEDINAPE